MTGIFWKRKKTFIPARRGCQYNLVTLNQTVLLVILLQLDSMCSYLLHPSDQRLVFVIELLKIIFIENIFFKFLIPVYLLSSSRRHYPILWVDRRQKTNDFFMTTPSFKARPIFSKYQTNHHNSVQDVEKISSDLGFTKSSAHITVTVHAPSGRGCSLPLIYN